MPGLLDLPAELIEQIYDDFRRATYWDDRAQLGYLRLTCRYVEKAVRHRFLEKRCRCVSLLTNGDASVTRFCAMTTTPDVTMAVQYITIIAYDDGTTETEARKLSLHSSDTDAASAGDQGLSEELRSLTPPALLRHQNGLIEVLRACKNVWGIHFQENDRGPVPHHKPRSTPNEPEVYYYDISSTFDFIMSLIVRAGIYPTYIGMIHGKLVAGLTNAKGLVTGKDALRRVEMLQLAFINDWRDDVQSAEEAGKRIGRQLYEGLDDLPMLAQLEMNFDNCETSLWAWDKLAQLPVFPALQRLSLQDCHIWVEDFAGLILKHCETLKHLNIFFVELWDGSADDLKGFLRELRTSSKLESFHVLILKLNDEDVDFPWACRPFGKEMDDEDGYVWVEVARSLGLKSAKEVEEGLRLMVDNMKIT